MKKTILILSILFSLIFLVSCQKAEYAKPDTQLTCVSSFTCSDWSNCINGTQTRTCNDASNCKDQTDSPKTIQSCDISSTKQTTSSNPNPLNVNYAKTGENYLEKGQIVSYKSKIIKLDRISTNAVLINVTNEMITLRTGQARSIDGIKLNLIATFDTTAATIEFS